MLAVHLRMRKLEILLVDAVHDRMRRVHDPEPFFFTRLAPAEQAARAHELTEDLRQVGRVQHDQPHSVEHAIVDAVHHRVGHLLVRRVAPPQQHVRLFQPLLAQAVLRLLQRRRVDQRIGPQPLRQPLGDRGVNPPGINLSHGLAGLLVHILVPDRHADGLWHVDTPLRAPSVTLS